MKKYCSSLTILTHTRCHHHRLGLGRWEVWGYGLFSLYKSDWSAVGNMNLEYGEKWGGEDYDLVDRWVHSSLQRCAQTPPA